MNPGWFKSHPPELVREVRRLLVETKDPALVSRTTGVHRVTLLGWNRAYGWIKLQRGPRGPRSRYGETPRFWLDDEPEMWRCECGKVNTGPRCESDTPETPAGCGHIPPWAEKGAAA